MAGLNIRLDGAEELSREMVKREARLALKIREALDDVGREVADDMRSRAPVDTGALKNSVKHEVREFAVFIGPKRAPRGDRPYAPYVEFGTARMAAQPFVYPTLPLAEVKLAQALTIALEGE